VERIRIDLDRRSAQQRLADYLRREHCVPDADADRRAEDLVALLGNGSSGGGGAVARLGGIGTLGLMSHAGALVDNWWLFALRGVLAILFGFIALFTPLTALVALVLVFGVWAFIDGIHALALAVTGWRSWQLVLGGLVGIAVGLFTFFRPSITALGLYAAIAAWSIARGVLEIVVAIEMRREVKGEGWLVVGGIISILFGVLMVALPAAGVLALAWLLGIYAFSFGVIMVVLSVRLYRLRHPKAEPAPAPRRLDVTPPQPA
jgi:uncharacterized membrane protein HdeD (DUF308 family)